MGRITEKGLSRALTAAKRESGRQVISCGGGLQLHAGTNRESWHVAYRFRGQPARKHLGLYPTIGLAEARTLAQAVQNDVLNGVDPRAQPLETAITFERAIERFIEEHAKPRNRTWKVQQRELSRYFASLNGALLENITRPQIRAIVNEIATAGLDPLPGLGRDRKAGGSPVQANKALAVIRKLFAWAEDEELVENNPARIKRPKPACRRSRVLNDVEIRAVWAAAGKMTSGRTDRGREPRYTPLPAMLQLLTLTGQRLNEIAGLRWSEVDLSAATITLPPSRTKNKVPHVVFLSELACEILESIPRSDKPDRPFVFSVTGGRQPAAWGRSQKIRLDELCGFSDWVIHDLRRTFRTRLSALGTPRHVAEKVMNHISGTNGGLVAVYDLHEYAEERREASHKFANLVQQIIAGNVVPFRRAARAS